MRLWLLLGAVALAPVAAASAQVRDGELRIERLARRPVIDGVIDEAEWAGAVRLDRWVQIAPADNGPPHGPTVAWIGYDDVALYLAVRAEDRSGRMRARLHERDTITRQAQDWIGFEIDPTNARRRAYSFAVNPRGVQGDGLDIEGTGFEEWDGIFDVAGSRADDHYLIEVAIPFESIRYPARAEQRWGFVLTRHYGRDGARDRPWAYDRDRGCELCQMITLTGISNIRSSTSFELNPTVVGRSAQSRPDPAAPLGSLDARGEFGANLKYGITPELTLDGTWNPDFSQVEADAGQLEVNNRFALFFPERRPFFLEGTDIFQTRFGLPGQDQSFSTPPVNVFYSRRIVDPDAGVKLTGKTGRLSVGLLGALDAAREYQLAGSVAGLSPSALDPFGGTARAGIARAKLDVLADGFVGAALTGRRFGDGYGVTATVDSRLRFGNTTFRMLATRSETREPDVLGRITRALAGRIPASALPAALDSLPEDVRALDHQSADGTALQASVDYDDRHWNAGLGFVDITPRFATPLGFTPRTDFAMATGYLAYTWQSAGFFQQIRPLIRFEEGYDHGGRDRLFHLGDRTDRLVSSFIDFKFPAATDFSIGYTRAFLRIDGVPFDGLDRAFVWLSSQAFTGFGFEVFIRGGEEAIFDDVVEGGPPLPSSFLSASVTTTTKPMTGVRLDLEVNAARVWRRSAAASRESRYAESAIPRLKTYLQLSRRVGIRLIGEYRVERFYRRDGIVDQKRDVLRSDALVTYLVHPGQSIQVGWTNLSESDLDTPMRTVARGGVAKLSYLWRF